MVQCSVLENITLVRKINRELDRGRRRETVTNLIHWHNLKKKKKTQTEQMEDIKD